MTHQAFEECLFVHLSVIAYYKQLHFIKTYSMQFIFKCILCKLNTVIKNMNYQIVLLLGHINNNSSIFWLSSGFFLFYFIC